jgi:hypothetical protein
LPTVASRIGGIPEIVEHQVTGLLVEPGNAVALAEALDELVASRELRGRLGREGRRRAAKRSYLQQAEAVLAVFRAVSEAPPHPTCSLPIAGLLGDDRQLFEAADKGRLEDGEDRSVRIIPVSWLTKRQTERLTRLYITKGNTRIRRFLAPIFSRMLSVLLMCLSARQRARLIVRLKQSRAISTGPGIL